MNNQRNSVPARNGGFNQRRKRYGSIVPLMWFFPVSVLFTELMTRSFTYGDMSFRQFIYILFFSLSGGALSAAIVAFLKNRTAARVLTIAFPSLLSLICSAQTVYFEIFGNYYSWESVGMAGEAMTDFAGVMFDAIFKCFFKIVALFLPVIAAAVFLKRLTYYNFKFRNVRVTAVMLALASLGFIVPSLMMSGDKAAYGDLYFYNHPSDSETYQKYGILTGSRLNIGKIIFGEKEGGLVIGGDETVAPPKKNTDTADTGTTPDPFGSETAGDVTTQEPEPPIPEGDNVMDIDFDSLIANEKNADILTLHKYFASCEPTAKNKYTGMFEGKNLIMMTLEAFSGKIISPEFTPLLYKMSTEGFVFNNYYCSCWGGSTATGEYANMTGNFYRKASCLKLSDGHYNPFTLGTQFNKIGYQAVNAYHAHTYTYYSRHLSHPAFGYNYIGWDSGIEDLVAADGTKIKNAWPRSDEETAKVTIGEYIDKQPFHAYYMTISGHANFSFGGNKMSARHKDDVADLPYSEEVRAYFACQYEVELMLEELVAQLDAAGILEDTVFVMAADHYPFGLSKESLSELYDLPTDNVYKYLDLYKNTLIIWSASMKEPVIVDEPCSAYDIIPTVSNLFGLEYDSRLMIGTDILSDTDNLAIVNGDKTGSSWNWVNKYGTYTTNNGKFTVNPGYEFESSSAQKAYVKSINEKIKTMRSVAAGILDNDYYAYVFGKK